MTYIISLEQDRKWYGVSSLYLNKHKTIINTTATTFDVTKGSPWDLVCRLVTHKLVWPVVSCQLVLLLLLLLPKQTFDIIKSVLWSLSWQSTNIKRLKILQISFAAAAARSRSQLSAKTNIRRNKKYKHPLTLKNTQVSWVNTNQFGLNLVVKHSFDVMRASCKAQLKNLIVGN